MSTTEVISKDETKVVQLAEELLKKFPPAKTSVVEFLGAQYDMGWNGDELIIVCQMKKEMMRMHPNDRLDRCTSLLTALRRYWYITAVTMVAEGYCSLDPEKTKGVELAKDFAKQDSAVEECITLTHAEIIDNTIKM